ncbi:MAG: 4a-hydroxytetrahydrobiopterin dehydratase, partial [Actinomycetota bacterium]|nr:4a-hydroxytetrahydrobiopterin dehydratase [Actinomycetota bacterium]
DHHPDIDIRWNKVKLVLTTHAEGGLTPWDFDFANEVEQTIAT